MRLIALALALCFALAPMQGATRPAKVKSHAVKSRAVKSKVVKAKKNPKVKGRKAARQPKRTTVTRRSN
jgi:hypothetical protein